MTKPSAPRPKSITESHADVLSHLVASGKGRGVLEAHSLMIVWAGLWGGDCLKPEIEIAKKLNVGRSKVREALIAWQNMGIATCNKKAGTRLPVEVPSNDPHLPLAPATVARESEAAAKYMEEILDLVESEIRQVMEGQS